MPFIAKRRHAAKGESRVWAAVLTRVLKRPLRVGACSPAACSSPSASPRSACSSRTRASTATRAASRSIQTYDRLQAAFPGGAVPATTVIKADDVTAAPVQAAIAQLHDQALATGQLSEPSHVEISPDKTVAVVALSVKGSGTDAASERSLEIAALRGRPRHRRQAGRRRGRRDRRDRELEGLHRRHDRRTRRSCSRSCSASRSSCCWSRSARSWCRSRRSSSTCCRSARPTASSCSSSRTATARRCSTSSPSAASPPVIPLFLFVILFGLSMDYHVLILSRVREAVESRHEQRRRGRPRHQEHGRRRDQRRARDGRGVRLLRARPATSSPSRSASASPPRS